MLNKSLGHTRGTRKTGVIFYRPDCTPLNTYGRVLEAVKVIRVVEAPFND